MKHRFEKIKKSLVVLLTGIIAFSGVQMYGSAYTGADERVKVSNPVYDAESDTTQWDYVYFGNYPQSVITGSALTSDITDAEYDENGDAVVGSMKIRRMKKTDANYSSKELAEGFYDWNSLNGGYVYFKYEPMKWRVLQNEGDTLLLLSDMVLDCQYYVRSDRKVKWADCSIRSWLNGYSPYNNIGWAFNATGFSEEEENAIVTSDLTNPANPFHGTNGGSDTQDKIFLMSVPEMTNEAYGFPSNYMTYSKTRQLKATDYAKAMGVWMGSRNGIYDDNAIWMLRTPGSYSQTISLVYWFGHVYQDGYYADRAYYGVAPALRVDASSDAWTYAGSGSSSSDNDSLTVNSGSLVTKISEDTEFSLTDAKTALEIALGIKEFAQAHKAYDLDSDGNVSLLEVKEILCYALGINKYPENSQKPGTTATPGVTEVPDNTGKPGVTEVPDNTGKPGTTNVPDATDSPLNPTESPDSNMTAQPQPTPVTKPTQTPLPAESSTTGPLVQVDYEPSGKIWIAGDSIADYHAKNGYIQPLYGWGEILGNYLKDNKTIRFSNQLISDKNYFEKIDGASDKYSTLLINTALSSRSSKSFTNENNYSNITTLMDKGDYLLISFGHNDERADVSLYTDPFGSSSDVHSFKWYLKTYYIDPAIRAGVQPVLISPVPRRYFYNGEFINPQLHTPYGKAMKELADEYAQMGIKVYFIDLHTYMLDKYEKLGEEGTIALHGKYGNTMDNTHLSQEGATIVSEYIISQMKAQNMSISGLLAD